MVNIRNYALPCIVIFWLAIALSVVSCVILIRRDYNKEYRHRLEIFEKDQNYIDGNCRDKNVMDSRDATKECHMRMHRVEEDPTEYAFYDVISDRGLCFGYNCANVVSISGVSSTLLVCFVLWLACGFKIGSVGYSQYNQPFLLPSQFHQTNLKSTYDEKSPSLTSSTSTGYTFQNTPSSAKKRE